MVDRIEIVGIGRTCAKERWTRGLVDLAVEAAGAALDDGGSVSPSAVIVSNALGGALGDQQNLGAFTASRIGLGKVEAHSVSCDEASGGAALRLASALVSAGMHEAVLVVGAEKTSDVLPDQLEAVRATGLDAIREAGFGFGPAVASGLGMQRYGAMHGVDRNLFYHLAATAHLHGATNPLAFLPWELSFDQYIRSPMVADPLTVCDLAPICDGGAAVLIRKGSGRSSSSVHILGSSSVSVPTGISESIISLSLPAAAHCATQALREAGLRIGDLSFLDLHDSSSFVAALSIEAVGLAKRGEALFRARDGHFRFDGPAPLWTFGGLKARGNAPGADGLFQVAEATLQLRGNAGEGQIDGADSALVQCLGSFGATAVAHVLG
jgi:acetyl-CoA C-acetyltransferase